MGLQVIAVHRSCFYQKRQLRYPTISDKGRFEDTSESVHTLTARLLQRSTVKNIWHLN